MYVTTRDVVSILLLHCTHTTKVQSAHCTAPQKICKHCIAPSAPQKNKIAYQKYDDKKYRLDLLHEFDDLQAKDQHWTVIMIKQSLFEY